MVLLVAVCVAGGQTTVFVAVGSCQDNKRRAELATSTRSSPPPPLTPAHISAPTTLPFATAPPPRLSRNCRSGRLPVGASRAPLRGDFGGRGVEGRAACFSRHFPTLHPPLCPPPHPLRPPNPFSAHAQWLPADADRTLWSSMMRRGVCHVTRRHTTRRAADDGLVPS